MDDIRYAELRFLLAVANGSINPFVGRSEAKANAVGLKIDVYTDMAATLLEELYVRFKNDLTQLVVWRLRGELAQDHPAPGGIGVHYWANPRAEIYRQLTGQFVQELVITYRGLRRIEELRDLLRRERILEPFGILLDIRYLLPDLQDALSRGADVPVSVIYADMDRFKPINDKFGHEAGDVVMKAYLEVVRDSVGQFGSAYRGRGDETVCVIPGLGHVRVVVIAETVRKCVAALAGHHQGRLLPKVTASLGVASTPPEPRTADIETVAESRNRKAKDLGRNRVVLA